MLIDGKEYTKKEIAALDVDATNCFTPECPDELAVIGGTEIVPELNKQAKLVELRTFSKDAHPPNADWVATPAEPQYSLIAGNPLNMDIRWNGHSNLGTYGFELITGLPLVAEYAFGVYKGLEKDMHPYGACYHDFAERISTGLIEWYHYNGIKIVIVGGLATDYCVKLTVLQLRRAGFIVILNLGACRGIAPETVQAAIDHMRIAGAIIVENTDEIIEKFMK